MEISDPCYHNKMSVRLFVLCFTSVCCQICFCPNIASILSISCRALSSLGHRHWYFWATQKLLEKWTLKTAVGHADSTKLCIPATFHIFCDMLHMCLSFCVDLWCTLRETCVKLLPSDRTGDQHTCLSVWIYWLGIWVTQVPHYWVHTTCLSSWVYCSVVISLACVGVCTSN